MGDEALGKQGLEAKDFKLARHAVYMTKRREFGVLNPGCSPKQGEQKDPNPNPANT
jgi:hypothetical protein